MQMVRCRFYDNDTRAPIGQGCHKHKFGACSFVHPDQSGWETSVPARSKPWSGPKGASTRAAPPSSGSPWTDTAWNSEPSETEKTNPPRMTGTNGTPLGNSRGWGDAPSSTSAPSGPKWGDNGGASGSRGWGNPPSSTSASSVPTGWGSSSASGSGGWGDPPASTFASSLPTGGDSGSGTAWGLSEEEESQAWGGGSKWTASDPSLESDIQAAQWGSASGWGADNRQKSAPKPAREEQKMDVDVPTPKTDPPPKPKNRKEHGQDEPKQPEPEKKTSTVPVPRPEKPKLLPVTDSRKSILAPFAELPLSPTSTEMGIMTPRSTGSIGPPLTNVDAIKTLVRAAYVRQDRDNCSKQYDQWRMTQRSKTFASIGKTAREELDRHAAELKWRRDSQDKLLSSLIDRLTGLAENPHALDMESVLKEAKRYTLEAQQWIESLPLSRQAIPPTPVPSKLETFHPVAPDPEPSNPEAPSPHVPRPLDTEGDIEMEGGEVIGDHFSEQPEFVANASVMRLWLRIMTIEGKLNEIELNPISVVSTDVAALVDRALDSRNAVEDGELSNINDNPKIIALDQSRAELQRAQDRLLEITKEKQAQSAVTQTLETQLIACRARVEELEARETERAAHFKALQTAAEDSAKQMVDLATEVRKLHEFKKRPPPEPVITPNLINTIHMLLRQSVKDDVRILAKAMKESTAQHIGACDGRLYKALFERLQPIITLTDSLAALTEGDADV